VASLEQDLLAHLVTIFALASLQTLLHYRTVSLTSASLPQTLDLEVRGPVPRIAVPTACEEFGVRALAMFDRDSGCCHQGREKCEGGECCEGS
jgi:hypothetical protein